MVDNSLLFSLFLQRSFLQVKFWKVYTALEDKTIKGRKCIKLFTNPEINAEREIKCSAKEHQRY